SGGRFINMKFPQRFAVLAVSLLLLPGGSLQAQFKVIHSFPAGANDGGDPNGSLVTDGTTLCGAPFLGGSSDGFYGFGSGFRIDPDGNNFQVIHGFTGGANDGLLPAGAVTLAGSMLYGVTIEGGSYNSGTVFKVSTTGTDFQLLHHFAGPPVD